MQHRIIGTMSVHRVAAQRCAVFAAPRGARSFSRNASGHGWFQKFQKEGEEGFQRYNAPTPFDWSEAGRTAKVFMDIG